MIIIIPHLYLIMNFKIVKIKITGHFTDFIIQIQNKFVIKSIIGFFPFF